MCLCSKRNDQGQNLHTPGTKKPWLYSFREDTVLARLRFIFLFPVGFFYFLPLCLLAVSRSLQFLYSYEWLSFKSRYRTTAVLTGKLQFVRSPPASEWVFLMRDVLDTLLEQQTLLCMWRSLLRLLITFPVTSPFTELRVPAPPGFLPKRAYSTSRVLYLESCT
ncbi:hypothetical protein EI94DRAFT_1017444 [Lactarius quietus]|nr:hypothetical protein EI94DRAFT_1017444 [Lactarius quietus]